MKHAIVNYYLVTAVQFGDQEWSGSLTSGAVVILFPWWFHSRTTFAPLNPQVPNAWSIIAESLRQTVREQ